MLRDDTHQDEACFKGLPQSAGAACGYFIVPQSAGLCKFFRASLRRAPCGQGSNSRWMTINLNYPFARPQPPDLAVLREWRTAHWYYVETAREEGKRLDLWLAFAYNRDKSTKCGLAVRAQIPERSYFRP